ncbi:hypothetical protein BH18VER2_BH18VER2_13390 [soil metagenome]
MVRDWLSVVAWTLFIYFTIPLARSLQQWVTEHWTRAAFSWAVYASIAIGVLAAIHQFRRRAVPVARRQWMVLGVLAAIFAWGTWHLRVNAEEAIHLPQYGVLSLLLYRAFSRRYGDRGAYACAALLGTFLGIFDEVIQWAVPRRFFEFRDIQINVLSVLLIQAGLAAGLATRCRAVPGGLPSARVAWSLATVVVLVLLGCFSNTPHVWRPLQSSWPNLFVFGEEMVQYGHRIDDPEVGWFKSRLTAEQLRETDRSRAQEAGEILRRLGHDACYDAFLAQYSPARDPFLHELRVRLFRRDRYWNLARVEHGDPAKHKELLSISFTEQRLLENWYPRTLRAAAMDWPADLRARAEAAASGKPRESPVSRGLITVFNKRQAQMGLGALLVVVVLAAAYDLHRRGRNMA